MVFKAFVIRVEGGYWTQKGVPCLFHNQTIAAHIEYVTRPIGEDVRRLAHVIVTIEELPEPVWGQPEKPINDTPGT